MKIEQFELILENGEKVACIKAGQGKRMAFICGPGSFYLNSLSMLEDEYTFFTHDPMWTYKKSASLAEKDVISVTKESIKKQDHLVVQALKKHFKVEKIDGMGFSAPGSFLFEEALEHPEDFDKIIATGIGLTELDPTFTKTNAFFEDAATPERRHAYSSLQGQHQTFQKESVKGYFENPSLFCLFDAKPTTKFPLKPHKQFIAETISMLPKIICDYSDLEKSKLMIIDHWKHNPLGEHIDKRMQEHFFMKIFPQLNPIETLMKLSETEKRILLVYGDTDFITPLPKAVIQQLHKISKIRLAILPDCGHMSYKEKPKEYTDAVVDFIKPPQIVSLPKSKL